MAVISSNVSFEAASVGLPTLLRCVLITSAMALGTMAFPVELLGPDRTDFVSLNAPGQMGPQGLGARAARPFQSLERRYLLHASAAREAGLDGPAEDLTKRALEAGEGRWPDPVTLSHLPAVSLGADQALLTVTEGRLRGMIAVQGSAERSASAKDDRAFPDALARALAAFDCWALSVLDRGPEAVTAACRKDALAALSVVSAFLHN